MESAISAITKENYYVSTTKVKEEAAKKEAAANKNKVTHDEFLKLILTQLTHQDPLKPMDDTAFLGQMAQIQALDEQIALTKTMIAFRRETQLQGASSLIGSYVYGKDKNGLDVEGEVVRAGISEGNVYVELRNGQRIPYENITEVRMVTPQDRAG